MSDIADTPAWLTTSMPWQRPAAARIEALLAADRMPHALLIAAPPGWGKRVFGAALARRLLALPPAAESADPTDTADHAPPVHPDLRWQAPEEVGSQLKVDQVRSVSSFLVTTAQAGGNKVAVLEDPDRMNASASNSLLKTLEEPSGSAVLLLLCARPQSLMPTVRSRCHLMSLTGPEQGVLDWLGRVAPGVDPEDRATALWLAGGAPLRARSWLTDGIEGAARFVGELMALQERALTPVGASDGWRKAAPGTLVDTWQRLVVAGRLGAVVPDRFASAASWIAGLPASSVLGFLDELQWAQRLLASTTNPNPNALLTQLAVAWAALAD